MKLPKITLVSGNKNKAEEVQRIIGIPLEFKDIDIDEIQSMDLEKVASHKLNEAYGIIGGPVIVDDVSFEIDTWESFPGPFIKWALKGKNDPSLILRILGDEENRKAKARLAVGFHDGEKQHIFIGEVLGTVSLEARGRDGFGWDKIFIPDGYGETFAEMEPEIKDSISHRRHALDKFKDFLKDNYDI